MEMYKAVYHISSCDHEMPDGTFEWNTNHLVYENVTKSEVESLYRLIVKGAEDRCKVEVDVFEIIEEDQEELREVV